LFSKFRDRLVDQQQLVGRGGGRQVRAVQIDSPDLTSAFPSLLAASVFDENGPHGLGCGSKEMASAVPVLDLVDVHQADVRLVDQRRGLERLAGFFLGESLRLWQQAVAGYYVWRDGKKMAAVTDAHELRYRRLRLKPPLEQSTFAVSAFDAAGNGSLLPAAAMAAR
jgi:hypothetical protein